MKLIVSALIIAFLGFSGCAKLTSDKTTVDSRLDSALANPSVPPAAPLAGPGEPQKGFDQEVQSSQQPGA